MSRFMRGLFQTARTISTIDPTAPAEGLGGRLPHGGVCCMVQHWYVCAIVFWRVVWYLAGTFFCMRSWPCVSWPRRALAVVAVVAVRHVVAVASLGVAVAVPWLWRPPSFRRRRAVATRRRTLVFAMVYAVSVLSWFAI